MKKIIPIFMMILIMLGACSDEKDPIMVTGVTLNVNSLELKEGETAMLEVAVSPADADNKNVTWSSSNTSVATVDSQGKVNVVGVGTTIITVKTVDGGKTATCTVTVTAKEDPTPDPEPDPEPDPIPVDGVTLDADSMELEEGETGQLTATVTPDDADNKNVTWSSSDESIATVDQNGKITAVKEGTAIITVTTEDGGKTATCTVTVTAKEEPAPDPDPEPDPIPVAGVTLDADSMELKEGETGQLTVTVTPDDADNKNVIWSSSDESIATVDQNGKVTAIKKGTVTITVNTEDGNFMATCIVTVKKKYVPTPDTTVRVTGVKMIAASTDNYNETDKVYELYEEESMTFTVSVQPENASNKNVTWTSSEPEVASVTDGKVKALRAGTTTITVKTNDGSYTATAIVRVKAKGSMGTETEPGGNTGGGGIEW